MIILDGQHVADKIQTSLIPRITSLKQKNVFPSLAVILANDSFESRTYVSMKQKICEKLGIQCKIHHCYQSNESELISLIEDINNSINIHGILIQLP